MLVADVFIGSYAVSNRQLPSSYYTHESSLLLAIRRSGMRGAC
jgi:hypothetical protein